MEICIKIIILSIFVFQLKAIEIVPNRQYLSYKDDRIQFDCIDPNMMPMNNGSIVTFMIAGKLVYDSSINYLGPGVTKLSSNSIVTTSITGGIVNAICTINGMASPPIPIIPYVSTVSFDVNRTELEIGQIFEAKCDFIVTPLALTTFNVSFVKDQSIVIGQYRVVDRNAIWTRPEIVEGIDIANGKVTTTQWGVIIDPKSDESNGIYGCEVSLPHPHESIIFRSNEWNANSNGCNTVKNSWFIILLSIMIAIIMVKH